MNIPGNKIPDNNGMRAVIVGAAVFVFFILASFVFIQQVFATSVASGRCTYNAYGYTHSEERSRSFPDEATCRAYAARGNAICAEYSGGLPGAFTLTRNCTSDEQQCQDKYGGNIHAEGDRCVCNAGYNFVGDKCITVDESCRERYGGNIHGEGDTCACDTGYNFANDRCVTLDESCQAKYGANIHGEGDQCTCDTGYTFAGDKCVVQDQDKGCREKYGANIHADGDQCSCDTGYNFLDNACVLAGDSCRSTYGENSYDKDGSCYCKTGYTFDEKKVCVPESVFPWRDNNTDKKYSERTNNADKKDDEDAKAAAENWLKSGGHDLKDIKNTTNSDIKMLAAALTEERIASQEARAREKLKKANDALSQALDDMSAYDPATRERIRQQFLDAWLDDPKNKETNLMMAMLERERGNDSTADIYEKLAYASLKRSERAALDSKAAKAKALTYDDIFSSLESEKRQEEVERTWRKQELEKSSLMNRMKDEIDANIISAHKAAKAICDSTSSCDWAYAKKVEIMTKAENFSQKMRNSMNDPLKEIFGIDIQKTISQLGGQKSANGE